MRFSPSSLVLPFLLASSSAQAELNLNWLKRGTVNQASTCAPSVSISPSTLSVAVNDLLSYPTFTINDGGAACNSVDIVNVWMMDALGLLTLTQCSLAEHGQDITATCPFLLSALNIGLYQLCFQIEDPYRNVINQCRSFSVARSRAGAATTASPLTISSSITPLAISSSAAKTTSSSVSSPSSTPLLVTSTAATTPAAFGGGIAKIGVAITTTSSSSAAIPTTSTPAVATSSSASLSLAAAVKIGGSSVVASSSAVAVSSSSSASAPASSSTPTAALSTTTSSSASTATAQTTPAAFGGGGGIVVKAAAATTAFSTTTTTTTSAKLTSTTNSSPAAASTTSAAQVCANSVYFSPSTLSYSTTDSASKVASGAYYSLVSCGSNQGLSVNLQDSAGNVLSTCSLPPSVNLGILGQTVTCSSIGGSLPAGSYQLCYVTQDSTGHQGHGCYPITINHPATSSTSTSSKPAASSTATTPTPTSTPTPTPTPTPASTAATTTTTTPAAFNPAGNKVAVVASPAARKRALAEDAHEILPSGFSCPSTFTACPVWGRPHVWECIDIMSDIDSCGGCPGDDERSQDCSSIAGADEVHCIAGRCVVATCDKWHTLTLNGSCGGRPSRSIYD